MKSFGVLLGLLFLLGACHKEAGEGGKSIIKGKVFVQDYNTNGTILISEYYGPDIDVYIIYGADNTYFNDRIRTSYDGSFEFPYLAKGKYRVFAYEKCLTCPSGVKEVILETAITKNKSEIELPDLVIKD
jgi:hypothetical protein